MNKNAVNALTFINEYINSSLLIWVSELIAHKKGS